MNRKILSVESLLGTSSPRELKGPRRILTTIAGCVAVILFSGCAYFATEPMEKLTYETQGPTKNQHLIVFMRGLGCSHTCFEELGFVGAVRKRGLPFDMVAPAAHFGYYQARNLELRLKQDIIEPAKAKGYRKIWLVGLSMGGLGSIFYVKRYPHDIEGVIAISPFLGYGSVIKEIQDAGGLRKWDPGAYDKKDWPRLFWHWLKEYDMRHEELPPLYLGYGRDDPLSGSHALLAGVLPKEHVVQIEGGHTFSTFGDLWKIFLDKGIFD